MACVSPALFEDGDIQPSVCRKVLTWDCEHRLPLHVSKRGVASAEAVLIPPGCCLADFTHCVFERAVPVGTMVLDLQRAVEVVIAVHPDTPRCLPPKFRRCMLPCSYSRILTASDNNSEQVFYRLYHARLTPGVQEIEFSSPLGEPTNNFTMFVKECDFVPLHVEDLREEDSTNSRSASPQPRSKFPTDGARLQSRFNPAVEQIRSMQAARGGPCASEAPTLCLPTPLLSNNFSTLIPDNPGA